MLSPAKVKAPAAAPADVKEWQYKLLDVLNVHPEAQLSRTS